MSEWFSEYLTAQAKSKETKEYKSLKAARVAAIFSPLKPKAEKTK